MNPLNLITDAYERQARLYPALVLISPAVITVVALTKLSGMQALAAAFVSCGGAFLLAQLARDSGKKGEARLFTMWGGMPSITIFRHSDARLDPITKTRYHKALAAIIKGTKAPTATDETSDPSAADQVYTAWSHYLRVNTRDAKKHFLLFQENVSYGYRRNVWGLKPMGIVIGLITTGIGVWRCMAAFSARDPFSAAVIGALAFSLLMLALWIFWFTPNWVRVPADAYAARLTETIESLNSGKPSGAQTSKKGE